MAGPAAQGEVPPLKFLTVALVICCDEEESGGRLIDFRHKTTLCILNSNARNQFKETIGYIRDESTL